MKKLRNIKKKKFILDSQKIAKYLKPLNSIRQALTMKENMNQDEKKMV